MFGFLRVFRDDDTAVKESIDGAAFGSGIRHANVVAAAVQKWQLNDDQRAFLVKMMDQLGPLLILLLKAWLKV